MPKFFKKLYLETTIPSYLLAKPSRDILILSRQEITRKWWMRDHSRFSVFVSDLVLSESSSGDKKAAAQRRDFLAQFPLLEFNTDVGRLAQLYLDGGVVPPGSAGDAMHLAYASIHEMEFLCTWNFRHLANAFALPLLRNMNESHGIFVPHVCTPEELLGE
jgi:hypothetical protein